MNENGLRKRTLWPLRTDVDQGLVRSLEGTGTGPLFWEPVDMLEEAPELPPPPQPPPRRVEHLAFHTIAPSKCYARSALAGRRRRWIARRWTGTTLQTSCTAGVGRRRPCRWRRRPRRKRCGPTTATPPRTTRQAPRRETPRRRRHRPSRYGGARRGPHSHSALPSPVPVHGTRTG
jgi:hypothetical protein